MEFPTEIMNLIYGLWRPHFSKNKLQASMLQMVHFKSPRLTLKGPYHAAQQTKNPRTQLKFQYHLNHLDQQVLKKVRATSAFKLQIHHPNLSYLHYLDSLSNCYTNESRIKYFQIF